MVIKNIAFGGWTGVDLFFVLSGFLITGILWDTRSATRYFLNFYARRTLRIFPLYYATLVLLLFIVPLCITFAAHMPLFLRNDTKEIIQGFAATRLYWPLFFAYLANVLVAWKGFGLWLSHFWSLSVEEHFYLLWPFVVYRLKLHTLIMTSIMLIAGALVMRIVAVWLINPDAIYVLTFFRMDGLALGALLALLWPMPEHKAAIRYWARVAMPITGLFILGLFCYKGANSSLDPLSQTIGYTASILFYCSLLVRVLEAKRLNSIFQHWFLRFFGRYSYSIYIFHLVLAASAARFFALGNPLHFSIVVFTLKHFSSRQMTPLNKSLLWLDGVIYVLFVCAASVGIAMITWHMIEAPCLRLKRFFSYEEKGRLVEGAEIIGSLARS